MKNIRRLTTREEIESACNLLYHVYIERMAWKFLPDNPSHLRIEERNGKKLLLDRFVDISTWFGVFENSQIVSCIRIQGVDSDNKLELEGYEDSKVLHAFLPQNKDKCYELTKFAILPQYITPGIIKNLFLEVFRYCYEKGFSLSCCTHNNFLKKFYQRIGYPLTMEHAFKYEPDDPLAVNHYYADFEKGEVKHCYEQLRTNTRPLSFKQSKIFRALEVAAPALPVPVYWHDRNGVVLGINEHCLKAIGTSRAIVGKTPYEFYSTDIAEHILNHHNLVMDTGNVLAQEEKINDITTGQVKYFSSIKAPLYNDDGAVIGIVGTSIDTTAEKEAERLRNENERLEIENSYQNKLIKEQKIFKEIIDQAVHDIRSPLASLLILSSYTKNIPEEIRDVINGASKRINDIANNLLEKYWPERNKKNEEQNKFEKNNFQISLALQEIISEKKYEFFNLDVEFRISINPAGYLAFLFASEAAFKRMISNLINNAVEACEKRHGIITVCLNVSGTSIDIVVEDNGKGMSQHVVEKIMNDISVTEGKAEGHGIGYAQVRDTLQRNGGSLAIDSSQ
ncbi:MAG: PAS domain-containing sensor histidine kinase, partial [Myxococcales bacterium]|nr:PAS domain-containing sensor histidine kinase [Myxococcales bacterium]